MGGSLSIVLPLPELRQREIRRSGGVCRWPGCTHPGEELAHLEHRGMGGRTSVNRPDNVAWLCRQHHHDFDGATVHPSDLEALIDDVCTETTSACVWPGCAETPVTFRQVEPGVWPLRPYCRLHAAFPNLDRPVQGRHRMIGELLRVIVTR